MPSAYTQLVYHIVFSTKDRRPLITAKLEAELYPYIGGILREQGGKLLEIGGAQDHVHLVARLHPATSVAEIVRLIKANSSKWLRERGDLGKWLGWQTGYSAFSVSASQVAAVRRYVKNQREHHRRRNSKEELLVLLRKHRIEYDERYLWE
jgi:REP element-mobilizing transposase RayT